MTRISIWLNLALLAALVSVLAGPRLERHASPPATAEVLLSRQQPSVKAAPGASGRTEPEPFRWSQLESTNDYRAYVANLRAIGCPEATIRDIVRGAAERAFATKRRQLRLAADVPGPWSKQAENRLVHALLAQPASVSQTSVSENPRALTVEPTPLRATQAAAPASAENSFSSQKAARGPQWIAAAGYPLVFQRASAGGLGLSSSQTATIAQLQQQFVDAIGGLNQDPRDPTYLARWKLAQQNADDQLRGLIGNEAYLASQLQVYYRNFQQQVANAGSGPLTIDPDRLSQVK